MADRETTPVAIVGMACIFPGAPDLETFHKNLISGHDAISNVPANRWDPLYFDPNSNSPDRLYCRRGGFIDEYAEFAPVEFGFMPAAVAGSEPDQLLCLQVAARALVDAGIQTGRQPLERTGVILGRGGYPTTGMTRLINGIRTAEELIIVLRAALPNLPDSQLAKLKQEFQTKAQVGRSSDMVGLVPNLAASLITNRLNLNGPAYTVDAACASALVAIDQACQELSTKRCDLIIAGGVHLTHDVTFWSVFCELGVMSRSQEIRPFDRRADGLLLGEGVGLLVLKRWTEAKQDGNRIYAVIHGSGVASDGRESSLLQPNSDGQLKALQRAWLGCEQQPDQIGLIEAHGTGTIAGDLVEIETLGRFFGKRNSSKRAGLGSVKSMIGHCMPAAGAAGMIKTALAIHHGFLPPTLNCEQPHPQLAETRFQLIHQTHNWESEQRLAGVNAFGFGGINAHVVLGQAEPSAPKKWAGVDKEIKAVGTPLLVCAPTNQALLESLEKGQSGGQGPVRLAILDPDPDKLRQARKVIKRERAWRGRGQIWYSPRGLRTQGAKLAFLFPGVGPDFKPQVKDLADHFGLALPGHSQPGNLEEIGLGIIQVNRMLDSLFAKINVRPDFIAGHSIGEWSGMIASGMVDEAEVNDFIASLRPGSLQVPGIVFAAAGCSAELALEAMNDKSNVSITHDNCPHQVILCGEQAAVEQVVQKLQADGVLCQVLPFRSGFHSPVFKDYLEPHQRHIDSLSLHKPKIPLWSATTCQPYPDDPTNIKSLVLEHLISEVRFRELIEGLYANGTKIFIQMGTGPLAGFVDDILRGRDHLAISANVPDRSGLEQLARVAAALFVEGVNLALARLWPQVANQLHSQPIRLKLGVPLVGLQTEPISQAPILTSQPNDPLMAEFDALHQEMIASHQVIQAAMSRRAERVGSDTRLPGKAGQIRRLLSVETVPDLIDHSFFPQPDGWESVADRYPVVPMTMSIAMMIEAAQELVPHKKIIGIDSLNAHKWLIVEPPVEVSIVAKQEVEDSLRVSIEGYADCRVNLAENYPGPSSSQLEPMTQPRPAEITAQELYEDRWMFHGPAYQGIQELGPLGSNGIQGVIATPPGPGALLDNAGQLFGYWVQTANQVDRLSMPVQIDKIEFFGPHPKPNEQLSCQVRVREARGRLVAADIVLVQDGRLWCRIEGWHDLRFDSDPKLWQVLCKPEYKILSDIRPAGYAFYDDRNYRPPSRDWLSRRYLSENERKQMHAAGPRRARHWLLGRIAAKDATRHFLWQEEVRPIYPVEIHISYTEAGAPYIDDPIGKDLHISLAHTEQIAVAAVSYDREIGIDVEAIRSHPDSFYELTFNPEELKYIDKEKRDEWVTRLWCAKEAVAKKIKTGLGGNPRKFRVRQVEGQRVLVNQTWVATTREDNFIVALTED